jgi:N-acetyl-gamma-glutamyl-phosphate reductase
MNNHTAKIGIIGGAGYTAGELLRILLYHPYTKIEFVHSQSNAGKPISSAHTDLVGETTLHFTHEISTNIDVLFLCMGHGKSKEFLQQNTIPSSVKIIDLSTDFRLQPNTENFVYGLPELNKTAIRQSYHIANPGCFATAIQLAILPLAAKKWLCDEIHLHGITGSTGAGQSPSETTHFSWRNNNVAVYKAFTHQHLYEVQQSIQQLQPKFSHAVNFIPLRGNFSRGILISAYTNVDANEKELQTWYQDYYADAPFTIIKQEEPDMKQVVNTNKCVLNVRKINGKAFIISAIDNLLKGASGQAVQNMNLMMDFPENTGLQLKAIGF